MINAMRFLILLSLFIFQIPLQAKIYGPKRYDSKGLVGFVGAELYSASENFDENGEATGLPDSGSYLLADIPFGLRYFVGQQWAVEGELKFSQAQSESSAIVTGGTRSNTQFHEMRISTDYLISMTNFDLITEFEYTMPFSNISNTTDDVMVNEGASSMTAKLHLQTEFGATDLFSYLGYESRGEGRSTLLPWSVAMGQQRGSVFYGARLHGFQSISDDSDTSLTQKIARQALIAKVNGGAARFYGVNPSNFALEGLLFWQMTKSWKIQSRIGLDLAGENYSKGLFAGLNIVTDWGSLNPTSRRRIIKKNDSGIVRRAKGTGISVEPDTIDFQEDTFEQGDEQEYFAPPPAPRVQPKNVIDQAPSRNQIRDQMDDVEMKIELKKKKKPRK